MPRASLLTRALMSLEMKIVRSPARWRSAATARMRLSALSRSRAKSARGWLRATRIEPPCSFHTTPSNSAPWLRSRSSARVTVRALRPVSSLFFLKVSSSSITARGMTTSCSANLKIDCALWRSTFVSSTKCLRPTAPSRIEAFRASGDTPKSASVPCSFSMQALLWLELPWGESRPGTEHRDSAPLGPTFQPSSMKIARFWCGAPMEWSHPRGSRSVVDTTHSMPAVAASADASRGR